jgi:exonuclease VII small subunit
MSDTVFVTDGGEVTVNATRDEEIVRREQRVVEIIDRLESDNLGLADAKALRDEGHQLLKELREFVDLEDGSVSEYDK